LIRLQFQVKMLKKFINSHRTSTAPSSTETGASERPLVSKSQDSLFSQDIPKFSDQSHPEYALRVIKDLRETDRESMPQRFPMCTDWLVKPGPDGDTLFKRVVIVDTSQIRESRTKEELTRIAERLQKKYRQADCKNKSTPETVLCHSDLMHSKCTEYNTRTEGNSTNTHFQDSCIEDMKRELQKTSLGNTVRPRRAEPREIKRVLERQERFVSISKTTTTTTRMMLMTHGVIDDDKDMSDGSKHSFIDKIKAKALGIEPDQLLPWVQLGTDWASLINDIASQATG